MLRYRFEVCSESLKPVSPNIQSLARFIAWTLRDKPRRVCRNLLLALLLLCSGAGLAAAQSGDKPYDDKLLRLSEILGAVHYLRELCGASDGQTWRERMRELVDSEGSSAIRKARLARSFNQGYQSYSRTYKVCTPTAQTAILRFMTEGALIAEGLVRSIP